MRKWFVVLMVVAALLMLRAFAFSAPTVQSCGRWEHPVGNRCEPYQPPREVTVLHRY
jgi:hypothetical protein